MTASGGARGCGHSPNSSHQHNGTGRGHYTEGGGAVAMLMLLSLVGRAESE